MLPLPSHLSSAALSPSKPPRPEPLTPGLPPLAVAALWSATLIALAQPPPEPPDRCPSLPATRPKLLERQLRLGAVPLQLAGCRSHPAPLPGASVESVQPVPAGSTTPGPHLNVCGMPLCVGAGLHRASRARTRGPGRCRLTFLRRKDPTNRRERPPPGPATPTSPPRAAGFGFALLTAGRRNPWPSRPGAGSPGDGATWERQRRF